ncbi:MAG: VCBS repeat-containing protein, partial [Bacteroidota bacterium]
MKAKVIIGMILLSFGCQEATQQGASGKGPVFQLVSSRESNIDFANVIQHDVATNFNLFDFDYFYNGAGVGVGDVNNDGLPDIFFCGNQVPNRLYLNKGDMRFEDISESAGINQGKYWSNGVTFADVNADGYLDIYVSQGGPHEAEQRKNLLLLNQGDLTFEESAELLGLADQSISTQSAFFDYDKDGDLDCFVMNENPLYGVDPASFHQILFKDRNLAYESSSHLYRNDDGVFKDVTLASGIYRPTFGLGLVISDINQDGWLDIYMANDYYIPDILFINNGKGFFADQIAQRTSQVSFYGMGVDIADINNDLQQDIFVLDMASSDHKRSKTLMASMDPEAFNLLVDGFGFQSQYMFNSLQLNDGQGQFDNIAHYGHLAKTDWSWAVLMEDFDGDSYKDIYVTNGYRRYALDNDFKNAVNDAQSRYIGDVPLDVKNELYDAMPSERLPNLMYRGSEALDFEEVADQWGLGDPTYSNGATFADLDLDGDLDLVVNNMDSEAHLFENLRGNAANYLRVKVTGENSESFAKITIAYGEQTQIQEIKRVRGYMSAVEPIAHFGLGPVAKVSKVKIEWPDGEVEVKNDVDANQVLTFSREERNSGAIVGTVDDEMYRSLDASELGLGFSHQENAFDDFAREVLLPYKQSTMGPMMAYDEDSKMLFVGGAMNQPFSIYQVRGERFEKIVDGADPEKEDLGAAFFDLDNDGDQEIYVMSGGNEGPLGDPYYKDRVYDGFQSGTVAPVPLEALQQYAFSGRAVASIDYDKDGWEDLVVGNRIVPQNYP